MNEGEKINPRLGQPPIIVGLSGYEPIGVGNICTGGAYMCPSQTFGGSSSGTVAPPHITSISPNFAKLGTNTAVTISGTGFGTSPQVNPDGSGITITISSSPPPTNTSITAVFSTSSTTPLGSQNVTVKNGNTPSDNSVIFEVIPTSTAVPVNFHLTSTQDLGGGVTIGIERNGAWNSSTGSLNDLSSCSMREYVTYPNTNNATCPNNTPPQQCYYPTSPPWAAASGQGSVYPNPTSPTPGPANGGNDQDINSVKNLNFVKPYVANSFSATQYLQYSCNGGSWINLYGPTTITRCGFPIRHQMGWHDFRQRHYGNVAIQLAVGAKL